MKKLILTLLTLFVCLGSIQLSAQTLMPIPPHATPYTGIYARGYWFTAPCNFTIVGLRVSPEAGTGTQSIHVMKCNDPFPVATTGSTNFTTLYYTTGAPNNVIQVVNIPVTTGDQIGILGTTAGVCNSYGNGGFPTTINGFPVTPARFGFQGSIDLTAATSYWGEASTSTGQIGRIEMYYSVGPPCPPPTNPGATNIQSTSATVNWTGVSGSAGYDYIVDQNPSYTTGTFSNTTGNSANIPGLSPGTTYYLHVRNKCTGGGISSWVNFQFTTLPPCNNPSGFHVTNLLGTSATINWDPLASALSWDYIIDQSNATPSSSTGATNVPNPYDNINGLTEGNKYYIHIRANCTGEQSGWVLDSFSTPIVCHKPVISIDHINTDEAVAFWDPIPTAFEYEYAISTSENPPLQGGTRYEKTAIHTSALNDGKQYFVHVRSHCNSLGSISFSDWSKASFNTFPLAVGNVNNSDFGVEAYPNPASDILTVKINGANNEVGQINLADVSGKIVRSFSTTASEVRIDVKDLAAGIYLLKYSNAENHTMIKVNKK